MTQHHKKLVPVAHRVLQRRAISEEKVLPATRTTNNSPRPAQKSARRGPARIAAARVGCERALTGCQVEQILFAESRKAHLAADKPFISGNQPPQSFVRRDIRSVHLWVRGTQFTPNFILKVTGE
jgi:hypothetical protein